MSELESKVFRAIMYAGDKGVLQRNLWMELNIGSKKGSRIVARLEKRGLVRREKELYAGRWTYRLFATRKPVTLEPIVDCPCTYCTDLDRCGTVSEAMPETCEKLTQWLLKAKEKT
jgi:DNA-binding transcriptional MocR family regulator